MGFVFAARMIAEAILQRGGVGGNATPHLQTDSLYDDLKQRHNDYVFDAILVDGAIFLKDSLHGAKKRGGFGGRSPPHLQKTSLSRVLGS